MVISLRMGWRHILFATWPTDPQIIISHLPEALSLDTYDGEADEDYQRTWSLTGRGRLAGFGPQSLLK